MKSFRLSRAELYLLRESIQRSPHQAENGRDLGYSGDDLEMAELVCVSLDASLGQYRIERRNENLRVDREQRVIRLLNDPNARELALLRLQDAQVAFLEDLDARLGTDRLVVSLEDAEADWLSENFLKRTNWVGLDGVRERIIAVRKAVKKDAMIAWRSKEGTEPTVDDFDKKSEKIVDLPRKADADAEKAS